MARCFFVLFFFLCGTDGRTDGIDGGTEKKDKKFEC